MSYPPATPRAAGSLEPLPRVLVVASGASRCGTTVASALLAATAAAAGRRLVAVDATESGALRPLLGAALGPAAAPDHPPTSGADPLGAAPVVLDAPASALLPLFEAAPVVAGAAVLVDAGARLGPVLGALAAALAADLAAGLLVVTGTAPAQLAAAYALVKVAAQRKLAPAIEVVIVGGTAAEAADAFALLAGGARRFLDRPLALAAHVPEDPSLAVAFAAGMSVHDAAAGSPAAAALAPLAERWAASPRSAAAPSAAAPPRPTPRRPAVPGLSGPLAFAAAPAR